MGFAFQTSCLHIELFYIDQLNLCATFDIQASHLNFSHCIFHIRNRICILFIYFALETSYLDITCFYVMKRILGITFIYQASQWIWSLHLYFNLPFCLRYRNWFWYQICILEVAFHFWYRICILFTGFAYQISHQDFRLRIFVLFNRFSFQESGVNFFITFTFQACNFQFKQCIYISFIAFPFQASRFILGITFAYKIVIYNQAQFRHHICILDIEFEFLSLPLHTIPHFCI